MGDNFIITKADEAVCLGSGEIKDCPFCGSHAISVGELNPKSGLTGYKVICTNVLGGDRCAASMNVCQKDPEQARREVIAQWNRRV